MPTATLRISTFQGPPPAREKGIPFFDSCATLENLRKKQASLSPCRSLFPMLLADLTWPDLDALDKDTPVVFPVAALEQHGRHLPLFIAR